MELSVNWKELQATKSFCNTKKQPRDHLDTRRKNPRKRKQPPASPLSQPSKILKPAKIKMNSDIATERVNEGLSARAEVGKYIAIDCEMVGVGPRPDRESALARVSAVNYNGEQVYDSFVRPKEPVTDWRTPVSGISPESMQQARSFEQAQTEISQILYGNVLIGHAVTNDLNALFLSHPRRDIRDTARHPPFRQLAGGGSPGLKLLAAGLLGLDIQGQAHSSVEDARATMLLFRRDKEAFDREHAKKWSARVGVSQEGPSQRTNKRKKNR